MDKRPSPSLLPILRSRQQGELLALILGDPELELSISQLAERSGVPYPSVHREIERAEAAGIVVSRKIGNTRLVRANTDSPYFAGLSDILIKAFGPPAVIGAALAPLDGIDAAYIYGSWAAAAGNKSDRPVADLDVLMLGEPDRDQLYAAIRPVESRLGRPVQVTIRPIGWLEAGHGSFHATVTERPLVALELSRSDTGQGNRHR